MSGAVFRLTAAVLLTVGGFCVGEARRQKLTARRRALESVLELLTRLRQEIAYRRTDLNRLYAVLAAGGSPGGPLEKVFRDAEGFGQMQPPTTLREEEAACFAACFGGLGHADAKQECARLDYYRERFDGFLNQAREEEHRSASLDRRLGLAVGAMLGLLVL